MTARNNYQITHFNAGLEAAAAALDQRSERLLTGKRRINQVDRHTAAVLANAARDIRAMKREKP